MNHYRLIAREVNGTPMALLEIYLEVEDKWSTILGNVIPTDEKGWANYIPYSFMERVSAYFDERPCESYTIMFSF